MRLLIKYPTRQRPLLFRQTVGHWIKLLANAADTSILITCDSDDWTMGDPEMRRFISALPIDCSVVYGTSRSKVEAINRDMAGYMRPWDILLLASDDMTPVVPGYDERIRAAFQSGGLNNLLWISDGRQNRICTIACMGRPYYDRYGYIYHPAYKSLWCDNEQTDQAIADGALLREPCLIRNDSPDWGGFVPRDALYARNNALYRTDKRTYLQRKKAGFPRTTAIDDAKEI